MLDLHTTHLAGHAVVRARGDLDDDASGLAEYLLARVEADDLSLVLDLHTLPAVDGAHGPAIAEAVKTAVARGARVVVVAGEPVRDSVRSADATIPVSESLDAALGHLAPPLDPERAHVHSNNPNYPIMAFGA